MTTACWRHLRNITKLVKYWVDSIWRSFSYQDTFLRHTTCRIRYWMRLPIKNSTPPLLLFLLNRQVGVKPCIGRLLSCIPPWGMCRTQHTSFASNTSAATADDTTRTSGQRQSRPLSGGRASTRTRSPGMLARSFELCSVLGAGWARGNWWAICLVLSPLWSNWWTLCMKTC